MYFFIALLGLILILAAYGWLVEPRLLAVRHVILGDGGRVRIAHVSDLHYAGNSRLMLRAVRVINESEPDLVCITGDFVSNSRWVAEALDQFSGIGAPVFAVPGNWDYWSGADLDLIAEFCRQSGGALLLDETAVLGELDLAVSGAVGKSSAWIPDEPEDMHILLVHYPLFAESFGQHRFDAILAGHSHGGQVRLPFVGALFVPYDVGRYDLGLFDTPAGPMYVTAGIGTSALPIRLGCRPEVAIIDL